MKKDYFAPVTEVIELDIQESLMQTSGTNWDDIGNGGQTPIIVIDDEE